MKVNGKFTDMFKYVIKRTNVLRNIFFSLTLMTLGAGNAWAQTDYSGVYFIANNDNYNAGTPTNNWYMVPAADPQKPKNIDAYYSSDEYISESGDPEKPFITTYKTNKDNNSIWQIISAGDGNYYIKHWKTGKYLIYAPPHSNAINRKCVHLETTDSPGANAKFAITDNGTGINIRPISLTSGNRFLNPAAGNKAYYNGSSADGAGNPWYFGLVGVYSGDTGSSIWYLERTVLPPTLSVNAAGGVEMSFAAAVAEGTNIYYTLDDSDPSFSGTRQTYTIGNPISTTDIANATGSAVKAVAVTADSKVSNVVELPLVNYTYHMVNVSNGPSLSAKKKQAVGTAISGTASIPSGIVSPYLTGETITFYSFSGDFSAAGLIEENIITKTTSEDDIYVKYTVDHLMDDSRFLHLRGIRPFNIKYDTYYQYYNSGLAGTTDTGSLTTTNTYWWYFMGNDPYNIKIKNASVAQHLTYDDPTLALADDASDSETFVLMGLAADGEKSRVLTLKSNVSGDDLTATAYEVAVSKRYFLIDKAGKLIQGEIPGTGSSLDLPDAWKSPLVSTYHYWNTATETSGTYTCTNKITDIAQSTETDIYVTYEVNNAIDITGGKTYLLKFLNGDPDGFYQEDGNDDVMTEKRKAIYPYNNGDFNLYVYGQERWEQQLADGASTRTRWLWKFVSSRNGTPLTGDNIDPYHVVIKSHQDQSLKISDTSYPGSTYLRTYKPNEKVGVVTSVAYENTSYPNSKPSDQPTEYMILGTSLSEMKLMTYNPVGTTRQTVTSFEQYWKNNPTAYNILKEANKTVADNATSLNDDQKAVLTARGWHTYEVWAYSAPWSSDPKASKTLASGDHWFQTISMGDGSFTVEAVDLAPQVILLDNHGWEIMRVPLSDTEKLKKYDSPMVSEYQWYPTASKVSGYHKYDISESDPKIKIYKYALKPASTSYDWIDSGETYTHVSTTLTDNPYDHITTPACEKPDCADASHNTQPDKVKTDFYVTYTVKGDVSNIYTGAATENATSAASVVLKQGGKYAQATSQTTVEAYSGTVNLEDVPDNLQWKLRPNFNIDEEMGYTGDAISYDIAQQGFDPYNVQIQSKANPQRYITTDTNSPALAAGVWSGTSSSVSLSNMGTKKTATGYDQTTLAITNATFMVVADANGNMRLMPRFDHSTVLTSITTLAAQTAAAPAGDHGTGTQSLDYGQAAKLVHSKDEITDLEGYYVLAGDFNFSGFTSLGSESQPFTGTLDGKLATFTGLTVPLVAYANNATIKNIIIDLGTTTITGGDNAGVICCTANGATRIYNCGVLGLGGSVSGTTNVGGIAGKIDGTSRVINCYSYANVTGGTNRAGIVGYNNCASKYNNLKTMVMNCMFYGDISTGGTISPIYGGLEISNDYNANTDNRLNNYNYYLYESPFSKNNTTSNKIISKYNCALAAEKRFLVRFEFYRHLLNSNRELAAWYATGDAANGRGIGDENKMAKWVLDKTIAPYPILKVQDTYPSVVNYDPENTYIKNEVTDKFESVSRSTISERNKGKNLGTLTVSITQGTGAPSGASITRSSIKLQRTDKDPDNYNFNYDKVQLPYYNEVGTGNYTENKVVTGWKVTVSGGTTSYSTSNYDAPNYNFADRDCTGKDNFATSGRIYSQGGYFNVPTGVTSISIEPYWGKAAYLSDACYDRYGYNNNDDLTQIGGGQRYTTGNTYSINGSNQIVYTTISSALAALAALTGVNNATVYDYAVVLVGNYHHHATTGKDGPELSSGSTPFTIMSIDLNKDNEPDYCLIYRSGKNKQICPIRFDFITVPGMVMAHKMASHGDLGIPGNCCPKGWFEITTTGLIKYGQFEHSYNGKSLAPLIFMGGVIDQFVANNTGSGESYNNKTKYMLFGDNVWFKMLSNGNHMDKTSPMPHRPISITGGEFESVYLSGYFRPDATACTSANGDSNAECYIDGGKFGEVAGAGQEKIDGNVTWLIDHADMESFYGGGVNKEKPITGNISTTIKNSHVGLFCGGPKFGDMASEKTVTTTATDCVFGTYFGAGYGGTSIYRECPKDYNQFTIKNYNFNSWVSGSYGNAGGGSYRGKYTAGKGVACGHDYELFAGSAGNVGRLYLQYASFSLAQTNNVTSSLTRCEVTGNFYGGGSLGKVTGDATSTLNSCTIRGNAFGAGYSASIPAASVMNTGGYTVNGVATNPNYNETTGVYEKADPPATEEFTWTHVASLSGGAQAIDGTTIKTTEDLTGLGTVAGNVTLNITGNTLVEGKIFDENGAVTAQTGGVFGGGAKSEVTGADKTVTVNINQTGGSATYYINNVYGGGDEGDVASEVVVNIQSESSYVAHDVFGGGNAADVKKNTEVNMTLGTVMGNIYGGGNLGDVGTIDKSNLRAYAWTGTDGNANSTDAYATTNSGVTHVTISGGSPNQNVYGGGKGAATSFWCEKGMVYATDVNISNVTVGGSVFGGGELGRVETDTKVMIGIETGEDHTEIKHNVYGGGQGVATHGYSALVRGNTLVTVRNGAKVDENVYGGGEIASVGKYNVDGHGYPYSLANNGSGICRVTIPGATQIVGDIFGGGKGVIPNYQASGENRSKRMVNYSATTHLEGDDTWDFADDHNYVWEYFANESAYLIYLQTLALATETEVTIDAGNPDSPVHSTKGNVYGGSENGIVQHNTSVTVQGKCIIGEGEGNGNIYGGGKGLEGNDGAGQVNGDATVNINSGTMIGSVFGGGVLGATKGNVTVNINGGTINQNVYGGGSLAHTNTSNWHLYSVVENPTNPQSEGLYERSFGGAYTKTTDEEPTANKTYYTQNTTPTWTDPTQKSALNKTRLNLRGGTITGDAFGGALGDGSHAPSVYGDILVELNNNNNDATADGTKAGCVVTHVFGCNNTNGTPKGNVLVHVYGTQNSAASHIANQEGDSGATIPKEKGRYDVAAVYGGGNQAAYNPVDPATNKTQVIIEGCDLTSIETVYGGGNAAAVPSTDVTVNSAYEINYLFGGGNGKSTASFTNPGADVGIHDVSGTPTNYGTGIAKTKLLGGEIHVVYGGSNEKGNIVGGTSIEVNDAGTCTLKVGQIYGAGNDAKMDGGTDIVMGCMPEGVIEEIYAGARNADVAGDVKLTLTSGKFGRVFGGNKHGGKLKGSITVNIEETGGCDQPLIIGELYGGGNLADYSIYGYNAETGAALESGSKLYNDPRLNVHAFTSIGAIYGGGYRAKMVANPTVDINVVKGSHAATAHAAGTLEDIPTERKNGSGEIVVGTPVDLSYPAHEAGKIGTIGNVFGGGNLAPIIGNATVNVGTATKSYFKTEPKHFRVDAETPLTPVAEGTYAGLYEATVEGAIIKGSIYGGGNEANITGNTQVNICAKYDSDASEYRRVAPGTAGITIDHDVFGAGKGKESDPTTALVSGNTTIVMMGGEVKQSVYGGGELSQVGRNTNITVNGGTIGTSNQGGEVYGNIYGGGKGNAVNVRSGLIMGNTNITVQDIVATAGNAAYYGVSEGTVVATPAILHNIYGGGAHGSVGTYTYASEAADAAINGYTSGGTATINILGGTIGTDGHNNGMVFGSSRGDIDAPNSIYDHVAWVYSTNVTIGGEGYNPHVKGSVYGSGENGHTYQNASVAIHSGMVGVTETMPTDPEGQGGAKYPYRGNVYGGGCGTDKYYSSPSLVTGTHTAHDGKGDKYNAQAGIVRGNTTVTIDGGHVVRDVFGAGSMGSVTGTTNVTIGGNAVIGAENSGGGYVYAAARGDNALTAAEKATMSIVGGTTLNISGGTIWESAFGGGQNGIVKGSVAVNVSGGVVKKDVYGGGALADTNTDNWNAAARPDLYVAVTGLTIHTETVTGSDVSSYYTRNVDGTYSQASGEAQANTIYYNKTTDSDGGWATGMNNSSTGTTYKTRVTLTGGVMGNVYGGALGDATTAANVYGDVELSVNESIATGKFGTARFTQDHESRTFTRTITDAAGNEITKSVTESYYTTGRVFGCNNINGTPKGNVNVTVWSTSRLNWGDHVDGEYEIQEVYGGGNLSAYTPAEGKKTEVHIHGCDSTNILYVFGGGNAATVPETDVNIHGCREIETVFGGGNGNEPVKNASGQWVESAGADVPGTATLTLMGGTIHSAFAGSFVKGTCGATILNDQDTSGSDGCTLKVTNLYGGGKDAPVLAGININISGCAADNEIENIYAGSYNARIFTGVTMNITGGVFKKVFGGNHQGGFIDGPIEINVEETDKCKPIIIDNLYGGGNFAPYPGPGTSISKGNIQVNIKSCTYIGNVFGGGYGTNAVVTGDTELNINMVKGNWAGAAAPLGYSSLPNVQKANYAKVVDPVVGDIGDYYEKSGDSFTKTSDVALDNDKTYYTKYDSPIDVIDDAIGTIGNVYGGGDLGAIHGNTIINIGNATQVGIMRRNTSGVIVNAAGNPVYDAKGMLVNGPVVLDPQTVLGAHIAGDVFGGSNQAEVTGNTTVNICAKENASTHVYETVAEGASGVVIQGTDYPYGVFGGGNKGNVGGNSTVYMGAGSVLQSVYGGGCRADVKGNASVTMLDGYVYDGVYGGGLHGSVGTFGTTTALTTSSNGVNHASHTGCIGKPTSCTSGGTCTVVVSGGQVGPNDAAISSKGMTTTADHGPVDVGFVFGAGRGEVENPDDDLDADFRTYVNTTNVTISGGLIMASVYGGGENGRVLGNTLVTISGGQIGCGVIDSGTPAAYTDGTGGSVNQFIDPTTANLSESTLNAAALAETSHWPFGYEEGGKTVFKPYDPYADDAPERFPGGSTAHPSDGKTYYGSVFGGGSGYFPYVKAQTGETVTDYDWLHSAGVVEGNTVVNITGGHILTNVYGGNEYTDVLGSCRVTMSGGTIGVPRTAAQIAAHPLSGLLFGAGKGDQRSRFYEMTNVGSTIVTVSGGIIYGSVFGGAEDGHVLGNTSITINDGAKIGTWGTTGLDGNVFGGGRGFSGTTLGAGNVGGNVTLDIKGGKILGSIYGGGRMASVGTNFSSVQSTSSGQFIEDGEAVKYQAGDYLPVGKAVGDDKMPTGNHGHITINISGGIIGNTSEDAVVAANGHTTGGNVFGGSMGRLTLLDGTPSGLWVKMAQAKATSITISNGTIKSNVYGAGELGTTRDNATINITAGTINGSVFGGGYGSAEHRDAYRGSIRAGVAPDTVLYIFNPLQYAGCLGGEAIVNVSGGTVNGSVYGGGELASVGVIDYSVKEGGPISFGGKTYSYNTVKKHGSYDSSKKTFYDFGLSWPYEFEYVKTLKDGSTYKEGGKTTVNITGSATVSNYVFGGGKGMVAFNDEGSYDDITEQRYTEAHIANVRETAVTIGSGSDSPTVQTVYGGGNDGHVMEDANVTIKSGSIQNSVFGGGKGESTYTTYLWDPNNEGNNKAAPEPAHSWTAGKVYGNTNVTMNGGSVGWFIYGGGNLASVGKGNYSGGTDDYSTGGYGELPSANGNLWTTAYTEQNPTKDWAWHFLNSGIATVTIKGGTVGAANAGLENNIPKGSVFGGSRGYVAKSETKSPRYRYMPDFFLGYVNKAIVNIGGTTAEGPVATAGPTIYGSVYGGGQDGHVRNATEVKIFKGSIAGQGESTDNAGRSGNVFGAGSGIGTYKVIEDAVEKTYLNNSSGSVTCTTLVEVNGGSITRSIYGGGALASVGPYRPTGASSELHVATDDHKSCTYTKVDIKGGAIGGNVYGASRGPSEAFLASQFTDQDITYEREKFATDIWADVNISGGSIDGNVYGGGEGGRVTESTSVILTGGVIGTASAGGDVFGGGKGSLNLPAIVGDNATVELNPNMTAADEGCVVRRIFGCNDVNGSPKGHASVHVYATQHRNKTANPNIGTKYAKYENCTNKTIEQYDTYLRGLATTYDVALPADYAETIARTEYASLPGNNETEQQAALDKLKREALDELRGDISDKKYDVIAVYGGGNLAPYEPTSPTELTSVVIDGCELTSIRQVYGGGNAASTPANSLLVNGTYEIDEVFGGGNGKDPYKKENNEGVLKWYQNPGANVGYRDFTELGSETGEDQENAISQTDKSDALTPENRKANYAYGSGVATTTVLGGRIHYVYGGSNKRGNICTQALSVYQEAGFCDLDIDDVTGAGKDATTDGEAVLKMDCVSNVKNIYGGSTNADVYNNIVLTITNGTFENVFGGNNTNGAIHGSITVNIEEGGCQPIRIDNLYAGGYKAPYSVYGYEANTSGTTIPKLTGTDPVADPCINVISASYIGNIYGGGYQATVVGNPHVNVNMTKGKVEVVDTGTGEEHVYKDNLGKGTTYTVGDNTESISPEVTYYATVNAIRVEVFKVEGVAPDLDQDGIPDSDYMITEGGNTYVYKNKAGDTYYKVADVTSKTRYWAVLPIGYIDHNIYGGGNQAEIIGDTHVEIGTGTHHVMSDLDTDPEAAPVAWDPARNRADIRGSVFGGGLGADAYIKGNTYVTMGDGATVGENIYGGGELGPVGPFTTEDHKDYTFPTGKGVCNIEISGGQVGPETPAADKGNVFGGGKGQTVNTPYLCEEAMAYSTNVSITNGTVTGNVYGGGEIARLENNTVVTIGASGDDTSAPLIKGYVYGGGQGIATHGYSGLARGNSTVTIQGKAKVESSVYGGGELATMGRYVVVDGLPTTPIAGLGICTVTIRDNAEIGRDNMVMLHLDNEGNVINGEDGKPLPPDDYGHVFGAGRGASPGNYSYVGDDKPNRMVQGTPDAMTPFADDEEYLSFLETLALAGETHVTITGDAFVKGDVFGGSENGRVQTDTYVTISGGQIGAGEGKTEPYSAAQWTAAETAVRDGNNTDIAAAAADMPECAHWPYEAPFASYDMFASTVVGHEEEYPDGTSTRGGRRVASDGRTFYGNVFAGGSGYYPYKPGKWHAKAGYVVGNTHLTITGGHILTNVYGGNEVSDVGGTCNITMTGGTIGVPRTLAQIDAHPVTCYLFGAGQGDPRSFFNSDPATGSYGSANVGNTVVEISGGLIFGSVFGGAEDGHVLGNTQMTVKDVIDTSDPETPVVTSTPQIGTWGTSYVDGNIFGGGRGFSGLNLEAGNVVGNVTVNFQGGTMLGSIYGGGRLAGAGLDFSFPETPQNGFFQNDKFTAADAIARNARLSGALNSTDALTAAQATAYNTAMSASKSAGNTLTAEEAAAYNATLPGHVNEDDTHTTGLVTINVSGGVIGNNREIPAPAGFESWTDDEWTTWKKNNYIPKTTYDKATGLVKFAMGGKVYGGSMGRLTKLDGTTFNELWPKLGQVKNTIVNVTGGTIKRDVFGGGETGTVKENTHVKISGGEIKLDVFGGGYGSDDNTAAHLTVLEVGEGAGKMYFGYTPMMFAGCVGGNTNVEISNGKIGNNIYGGGEMASVGLIDYSLKEAAGGEYTYNTKTYAYKNNVKHTDKNSSFALSWPWKIAYSDLLEGGSTNVTVTGGRIGTSETGVVGNNGNIYGGSQGKAGDPHEFAFCGNVKNTYVTINYTGDTPTDDDGTTTPLILGSVFGGAEDGHVIEDTHLSMKNGLVKHSIFAGGRGQGTYLGTLKRIEGGDAGAAGSDIANVPVRSLTAGKVYGNTYLEMTGGTVWHNAFGGGYMASVGKGNYSGGSDDYATGGYGETITGKLWQHSASFNPNAPISPANVPVTDADYFLSSGKAYLTITGGTVGKLESDLWDGLPSGNVFGSSRGVSAPNITDFTKVSPEYCPDFFSGYVNETFMTIGGDYKCVKMCTDKNGTVYIPGRTVSANQMRALFTGTAILTGDTPSAEYWIPITGDGPKIYGSVYGGGQDGHVRREAHMIINKGEVGVPYTDENRTALGTSALSQTKELDDPRWMLRGNLFGAGSGLGQYAFDLNGDGDTTDAGETGYSTSAGSVTHFTLVDIMGGIIHRNVYGGGSLASVGPPPVGSTEITPKGSNPALYGNQSQNIINIYSTVGTPDGYPNGTTSFKFNPVYGGEVYGASRGVTTLDPTLYSTSIWTRVNIFDGAHILNNVFGGGDAGLVKKDTEVRIGDKEP